MNYYLNKIEMDSLLNDFFFIYCFIKIYHCSLMQRDETNQLELIIKSICKCKQ